MPTAKAFGSKPLLVFVSIGISVICAVLLIAIAATPSYYNGTLAYPGTPYSINYQFGAWKSCSSFSTNNMVAPHSILSRAHRLRTLQQFPGGGTIEIPPGGFPGGGGGTITIPGGGSVNVPVNPGGGSITIPGSGSIPVSGNPGGTTITIDPSNPGSQLPGGQLPGGQFPGGQFPGSNPSGGGSSPGGSFPGGSFPGGSLPGGGLPGGSSLQSGGSSSQSCATSTDSGDSKTGAIRGFLVLAILLAAGVVTLSTLSIVLSSHTSLFLMCAAGLSIAGGFCALISWAVVAGQLTDGAKLWWGFGLQVVINVVMWLVGGILIKASIDAKGNQVTQATIKHTQSNEAKATPVPLQPTTTNHQSWQQSQYGYPPQQPLGTSPPLQPNPVHNQH